MMDSITILLRSCSFLFRCNHGLFLSVFDITQNDRLYITTSYVKFKWTICIFSTQDKLVYHRQMTFGFDASSNQSSPFDIYHFISTHYFTAFPHNACIVESTTNTCGCKGLIWQYLNCRMSTLYIIMTVMKYPSCMIVLFKLILKSKFCHCQINISSEFAVTKHDIHQEKLPKPEKQTHNCVSICFTIFAAFHFFYTFPNKSFWHDRRGRQTCFW